MDFKQTRNVALILAFGLLAPMLDTTMTNIAINDIGRDLNTTLSSVQWIITAYVLATSIAVPLSGWLIQHFNGKYVFLTAELFFGLSSIGAALSHDINTLIIFRVIQGFASGLLLPLVTTMMAMISPREYLQKLMMVVMLPILAGPIFGPVIGAVVVQYSNWQWVFWINVPIMIIAAALNYWKIPDIPASNREAKIDAIGIALLGFASATIIYGFSQAGEKATFNNSDTWTYVTIGLIAAVVYLLWGRYKKGNAVLPLALFKSPVYAATTVNLVLAGMVTNGPMLILPLYFQQGRGMSVLATGLWLLPQGLGMLMMRPVLLRLLERIGVRYVVWLALTLSLVGTLPFVWIDAHTNIVLVGAILFVRGLGVGGVVMPLMTNILLGMEKDLIPHANTGARIFQNIGGAFGSAVIATIVATYLSTHRVLGANIVAYQHAFWLAIVMTLVMFIPAIFLPKEVQK
ncbi:DHA2 family efflux MFS transporter permease subunit [Fructobacillus ficulneus]|uniref:Major facilitator superfamily permease n=1 Tax=Fructobacillus ficulneus TaxID=157463 RepID=A0A0K8MIQ8_9LACO|nr:DHA2 family efflux MFS transporter permease subunit [Fructobacillus ficulneus]GAP00343.1 major facilitator superfamily permease [Fructobacillus ficulneus]